MVKNVPKTMSSWISQILPPVWSTLTSSSDKYLKEVVNESGVEDDIVDSDGEVLGWFYLLLTKNFYIFLFLGELTYLFNFV